REQSARHCGRGGADGDVGRFVAPLCQRHGRRHATVCHERKRRRRVGDAWRVSDAEGLRARVIHGAGESVCDVSGSHRARRRTIGDARSRSRIGDFLMGFTKASTETSVPTPAAGYVSTYPDAATKRLATLDESGIITKYGYALSNASVADVTGAYAADT